MSALADLVNGAQGGTTTTTTTPSSSSALSRLVSSGSIAPTSPETGSGGSSPSLAVPSSSDTSTPSFAGYGAASGAKDVSGKPFAIVPVTIPKTFMSPETTVPEVDKTRTAVTFDPTIAQKIDPNVLKTQHIESLSQSIRQALGATATQQLDHIIPIAFGGSYDMS